MKKAQNFRPEPFVSNLKADTPCRLCFVWERGVHRRCNEVLRNEVASPMKCCAMKLCFAQMKLRPKVANVKLFAERNIADTEQLNICALCAQLHCPAGTLHLPQATSFWLRQTSLLSQKALHSFTPPRCPRFSRLRPGGCRACNTRLFAPSAPRRCLLP